MQGHLNLKTIAYIDMLLGLYYATRRIRIRQLLAEKDIFYKAHEINYKNKTKILYYKNITSQFK